MGISQEARTLLYTKMYTAVSKATAEKMNANGESVKSTFNGRVSDLFKDLTNSHDVIAKFLWAISHKTEILPTVLFRIVNLGGKGVQISRVHSGFYDDQRNHITGIALVPFIMEAVLLYKPTPRVKKEPVEQLISYEQIGDSESPQVCYDETGRLDLTSMADDILINLQYEIQKEFERRAAVREKQARLQQVLELAEISIDELKDLLAL